MKKPPGATLVASRLIIGCKFTCMMTYTYFLFQLNSFMRHTYALTPSCSPINFPICSADRSAALVDAPVMRSVALMFVFPHGRRYLAVSCLAIIFTGAARRDADCQGGQVNAVTQNVL